MFNYCVTWHHLWACPHVPCTRSPESTKNLTNGLAQASSSEILIYSSLYGSIMYWDSSKYWSGEHLTCRTACYAYVLITISDCKQPRHHSNDTRPFPAGTIPLHTVNPERTIINVVPRVIWTMRLYGRKHTCFCEWWSVSLIFISRLCLLTRTGMTTRSW